MEGSLVMVVSLVYLVGLIVAGVAAWKRWLAVRWPWIAGYVVLCLLIPLVPFEEAPTAQVEAVIEQDRAAAEVRTEELPPRVEVDTGRDFEDALNRFGEAVEEQGEANEQTQKPVEM